MNHTPPRRWFAFRLRTLFVAVVALPIAWAGYSLNWIRERRQFIPKHRRYGLQEKTAPGGLWLFGESGVVAFTWPSDGDDPSGPWRADAERRSIEGMRRLFPETKVDDAFVIDPIP